ncbi:VOC family protein [Blastococcus sp. MG754426]|uniref:VOC family protein n=1 Tax=unclassified Blastococcus TaxID=2619396 RepID=UPI001EEFD217|nr:MULTISPECIES: VOC family protein [unclassified Blastococcus]MCF6510090.1 VOC family protein [Blastococcus sp. MG754426]MCF6514385.1 VOC family protein [Blastococcus sp. MG754427]MCF6737603.1 VOC family protein [Blastococcus sp. KM273129]
MAFDVQVTVDSSAPHDLADWWAQALGWQVEAQDEAFIRRMVDEGAATADDTTTHRGALVWKVGAAIRSPDPGRPRVLFQLVPEPKTVKNRLHLDVAAGPDRVEAEVARLVGLGARELWRGRQGPFAWVTLADPEGNEFCVT